MTAQKIEGTQPEPSEKILGEGLDKIIAEYEGKPGALILVLHKAQNLIGYLPREVQRKIADGLSIPLSDVAGVVTFYSFFTMVPKGRHSIKVCLGTSCYVRGGQKLLEELKKKLDVPVGGTTEDRRFSLEVVRCIGACGLSPALTVGEDVFGRVKNIKLGEILGKYN
ncbi:MAG: NAD(P)H-dependent oxidoreductase subunit E [Deltaproteobacteria bacterium]|nr:NAD(P)H-dependent oxidoreductase subunit E [Deltaproteobacteria bacterium]